MKDADACPSDYGFPMRFRLGAFGANETEHTIMETGNRFANPGGDPVIARFEPHAAKQVHLTTTTARENNKPRVATLAKMTILSGKRNVTIGAKVQSACLHNNPPSWSCIDLTYHFAPLSLPVAPGSGQLKSYHSVATKIAMPSSLTQRDHELPVHLVEGRTAKDIADTMYVGMHTKDTHTRGVHSRAAAISRASH